MTLQNLRGSVAVINVAQSQSPINLSEDGSQNVRTCAELEAEVKDKMKWENAWEGWGVTAQIL